LDEVSRRIRLFNREPLGPELDRSLLSLEKDGVIGRVWGRDWTVWKAEDREITDRLGWLTSPLSAGAEAAGLETFAAQLRGEGLTRAVVLGMGGSSLAPEVFARSFVTGPGSLDVEVLDTTEPETVAEAGTRLAPGKTLFIVSSKSGKTAELIALLSFFYDRARGELGDDGAGRRFVAITDPGSPLETLARSLRFRRTFQGRPDIGGRFSALSAFGLLPAAVKGVDLKRLLASAQAMAAECRAASVSDNPGAYLGAVLGTAAEKGLDKLTFFLPQHLVPLAGWLEQLIAESTGKQGKGIVPVIEGRPGSVEDYGKDRLFVELVGPGGPRSDNRARELVDAGRPLLQIELDDPYDLAGQFFLWEFATAIAAHFMKINPFDQPDVESTKKKTREVLAGTGTEKDPDLRGPALVAGALRFFSTGRPEGPEEAVSSFLHMGGERDYIAILAYLPQREGVERLLSGLAAILRRKFRFPVTVGFGPRYLHSTGQLHKGDGNRGLFLQLAAVDRPDILIPAVPGIERPAASFADLFAAQGRGDWLALADKGRRVLRIEIEAGVEPGLEKLMSLLG